MDRNLDFSSQNLVTTCKNCEYKEIENQGLKKKFEELSVKFTVLNRKLNDVQ
jgi:hypothetical protein